MKDVIDEKTREDLKNISQEILNISDRICCTLRFNDGNQLTEAGESRYRREIFRILFPMFIKKQDDKTINNIVVNIHTESNYDIYNMDI